MTSAELIARLKEIDPTGEMTVVEYDGCSNFCDIDPKFVAPRKTYVEKGRRKNTNVYHDEYYEGLEPVTVIYV